MSVEWTHGDIEKGDWLVYLNGVEVPSRSVRISCGRWQIPEATVTFPPHRLLKRVGFEDRIRLTVFYLDNHRYKVPDSDLDGPTYCLLFDGEVTSWNQRKRPASKHLSYHAIDLSNSLTNIFPHLVSNTKDLGQALTYVGSGNPASSAGSLPQLTSLYLLTKGFDGLNKGDIEKVNQNVDGEEQTVYETDESGNPDIIDRPYDFIRQIFSLLIDDALVGDIDKRSAITKLWYNNWADRTKFKYKWAPSPIIEDQDFFGVAEGEMPFPLLDAVRTNERHNVLKAAQNMASGLNGQPFWKVIQMVFQKMYYEVGFVTAPPIHRVDEDTRKITEDLSPGDDVSPETTTLMSYLTKPNGMFAVPPSFNVIWPSMTITTNISENYATQPTRTYMGNPFLLNALQKGNKRLAQWLATEAYPPEIAKMVDSTTENLAEEVAQQNQQSQSSERSFSESDANIYNGLVYPEEYLKGPVINSRVMPKWLKFLREVSDMKQLVNNYARYDHYRTRFEKRNGSVSQTFNPYIVSGFPTVVVDESVSNFHLYGYVSSYTHTLEAEGRTTQVRYINGRVIDEVFEGLTAQRALAQESNRDQDLYEAFPMNPIPLVRQVFQKKTAARSYYRKTFWGTGGQLESQFNDVGEEYIFDPKRIFNAAYIDANGEYVVEDLNFSGTSAEENNVVFNDELEKYPEFRVKSTYQAEAESASEALTYCSRPVCTMEQFIDFHEDRGVRRGPVPPSDPNEGKGALYYRQILDFNSGPPRKVASSEQGEVVEENYEAETRRNWTKRFLQFRQLAYNESFSRG